jgi:hypothetical protein
MALRRCSVAARGLWIEMLCVATQFEPYGYLAEGDRPLTAEEIAVMVGAKPAEVRRLTNELERRGVFSRDALGRIYSRRLVREAEALQRLRKNGAKGGNPNLIKRNSDGLDNQAVIQEAKPQSPEANSPESVSPASVQQAPLLRAAEVMGVSVDAFYKRRNWLVFGHAFETWRQDGCDPERDIWPTIAALRAKLGEVPESPVYFRKAVYEARDRRLAHSHVIGAPAVASGARVHASGVEAGAAIASPQLWADRLAVFATAGVWSRSWGPKPGAAGCLVPGEQRTEDGIQGSE